MDKTEFAKFVTIIRSAYQKHDFLKDVDSLSFWYLMLKDLPYELALTALQKHIATSKWLPSVAELRQCASELVQGAPRDWSDEWSAVIQAVRLYGYMREKDALETLAPITREIVRQIGWKTICFAEQSEIISLRANFRMIYNQKAERVRERASLPTEVQSNIAKLAGEVAKQVGVLQAERDTGACEPRSEDFSPERINCPTEK